MKIFKGIVTDYEDYRVTVAPLYGEGLTVRDVVVFSDQDKYIKEGTLGYVIGDEYNYIFFGPITDEKDIRESNEKRIYAGNDSYLSLFTNGDISIFSNKAGTVFSYNRDENSINMAIDKINIALFSPDKPLSLLHPMFKIISENTEMPTFTFSFALTPLGFLSPLITEVKFGGDEFMEVYVNAKKVMTFSKLGNWEINDFFNNVLKTSPTGIDISSNGKIKVNAGIVEIGDNVKPPTGLCSIPICPFSGASHTTNRM